MLNTFKACFNVFRPFNLQNRILLGAFLTVNLLVLLNALLHDPSIGYDALNHLKYVEVLSHFRLPSPGDSSEFYSPPLPYLFPALLMGTLSLSLWWAGKCAQLFNVVLSLGLILYLLKTCDLIKPRDSYFKLGTIAFLALLPVYYRTFAFVRGEPYVAFLAVLVAYHALRLFLFGEQTWFLIVVVGTTLGLLALARQWGFLLFPPVILLAVVPAIKDRSILPMRLKALAATLIISSAVGSWFYLVLFNRYGSVRAFSGKESPNFALSNQPASFYFGLASDKLFSDPIRPSFQNKLIPIFYSETWGDYWAYFIVYGRDKKTGKMIRGDDLETALQQQSWPDWLETNRDAITAYLGRVNLISLFPSTLALAGMILGTIHVRRLMGSPRVDEEAALAFLVLIVVFSLTGYLWFLIKYPLLRNGVTIKATYMLHVFPFIAILAGNALQSIRRKYRWIGAAMFAGFALVFVHNLPAMITRYTSW